MRVRKILVPQKTNTDYRRKEARMYIYGKVLIRTSVDKKKKKKRITLTYSQRKIFMVNILKISHVYPYYSDVLYIFIY